MMKLLYALVISIIAMPPAIQSQTPILPDTKKTGPASVSTQGGSQRKTIEDCACESQVLPEALAIVNDVRITRNDIAKTTRDSVSQLQTQVIEARKRELDLQINSRLLANESKRRGIGTTKLLEQEVVAKVKAPTDTEAQTFYDQNKERIEGDFKDVKEDIVRYLLDQRQRLEAKKFADLLRAAETKVLEAEVTPPLNDTERARVLATVNGETITSGDVEDSLKPIIFDVQQRVYKLRKDELELCVNDTLLVQEAQKRKVTVNALLDLEVKPKAVPRNRRIFSSNKTRNG